MSTLLSDLESSPATGDGDFVQNILNEMNGGPPQLPAVGGGNQGVINSPNPNTIMPHTMDNGPVTSHMIGNSHPTPADFTQMMNTQQPMAAPQGNGSMGGAAYAHASQQPSYTPPPPPKRSWLLRTADEFRVAFFVAILFFFFNLPMVNFLFAHYIPSMVKTTGELTWIGILVKCLMAGGAFWLLQRVIVPLLSF